MYVFVECSNTLKDEREFENIELIFSDLKNSLIIRNKKMNEKMYRYLLEFYLEDFSEEIIKTEEKKDEIEIFFRENWIFQIAKQKLIYKIDDRYDDSYFLLKELDKWEIRCESSNNKS